MKKYQKILTLPLLAALIFSGCKKDFLNKGVPQDALTDATYYQTAAELRASTAFLYGKPWFDYNWAFGYLVAETMSDNAVTGVGNSQAFSFLNFSVVVNDASLKYGWSSLYNVVAQSNTTINNIISVAPASLGTAKTGALGEARFIRATSYFQLVQIFGAVPIIEDNKKVANDPNLPRNIISDVYKFMINDLRYAATNLPLTDPTPGRVTAWSAKGMLAKVYLTRAGISGTRSQTDLDSAKFFAADVCKNSGLSLLPKYSDIFLTKNINNQECLFGLQWSVDPTSEYGNNDARQTNIEGQSDIDDIGGGGWSGLRISADLQKYFMASRNNVDPSINPTGEDLRRKPTYMLSGDVYPELISKAHPTGYPMKDTSGAYIKKYIVGGPLANQGLNITTQHNAIPTYLLRLDDVYLVLAEATLGTQGTTSDADALLYFNKLRIRAGLKTVSQLDFMTIFNERRLELALENQFWFDIKRWHDYNPTSAEAFVTAQHRNSFSYDANNPDYVNVHESNPVYVNGVKTGYLPYILTGIKPQVWTLSIPAVDLTTDPKLLDPPVPYFK